MNKEEYLNFIIKNHNIYTNKEMAEKLGISISYVTKIKRENNIPSKIQYNINKIQNQILLSGLLGDGSLKKNGSKNYYYRECHSVKEEEYLNWKFDNLFPLTKNCSITFSKKRKPTQNDQKAFNTKTLSELIPYSKLSKSEIIPELNELGLMLYILDDGWKHPHSKHTDKYNICLAVHGLKEEDKEALLFQFKTILGVEGNIINKKRDTISFPSQANETFIEILKKYDLYNLDVSIKKFR